MQPSTLRKRSPGTTTATTMNLLPLNPKTLLPPLPKLTTPSRPRPTLQQPLSDNHKPKTQPTNRPRPHQGKSLLDLQTERPAAPKTNTASRTVMRAMISSVELPVEHQEAPRKKGARMSKRIRKRRVMMMNQTGSRFQVSGVLAVGLGCSFLWKCCISQVGRWDIPSQTLGCHYLLYLVVMILFFESSYVSSSTYSALPCLQWIAVMELE